MPPTRAYRRTASRRRCAGTAPANEGIANEGIAPFPTNDGGCATGGGGEGQGRHLDAERGAQPAQQADDAVAFVMKQRSGQSYLYGITFEALRAWKPPAKANELVSEDQLLQTWKGTPTSRSWSRS